MTFRAGFVALVGRANVGKSTLLNALLDRKIAIATPKPQTTRISIRGIITRAESQLVIVDTPGVHRAGSPLSRRMARTTRGEARGVDRLFHIVDVSRPPREEDGYAADLCRAAGSPIWLVGNKADLVRDGETRLGQYRELASYEAAFAVSARTGAGLEELLEAALAALPEGVPYFPEDMVTDQPEDVYVAEIIREKILMRLEAEVPHAVAVMVEERTRRENGRMYIRAVIYVERETQKAIVIGAGGSMLKGIGAEARADLEEYYDGPVYLDLWVKVRPRWREREAWLNRLGFSGPEGP